MDPAEQTSVLGAMQAGTGDFTGLNTLRDNLNADVVMLVYDSSFATTVCGSAYSLQNPAGASTYAVVVIGDGCMGSWQQFTHEIGHVMGGRHDHPTGDSNICFAATGNSMMHGYTRTSAPIFRTIMGSSGSCDFSSCDRLNRWSDPDSTYSGYAMGVANQSNMVDVLGTSLCGGGGSLSLVADYQVPAGSAPGQPGTLTVTNMVCYGFNELTWGASSGNVGWYEVETSASSNYSSPSVVIRGSEYTELVIDVPGTRYVRVKACNGNGCSSWRNGNTTATYYSGCA